MILNYVVTGLIRAATPHVYLSTVIDETRAILPARSLGHWLWPRGGYCSGTISDSRRG